MCIKQGGGDHMVKDSVHAAHKDIGSYNAQDSTKSFNPWVNPWVNISSLFVRTLMYIASIHHSVHSIVLPVIKILFLLMMSINTQNGRAVLTQVWIMLSNKYYDEMSQLRIRHVCYVYIMSAWNLEALLNLKIYKTCCMNPSK